MTGDSTSPGGAGALDALSPAKRALLEQRIAARRSAGAQGARIPRRRDDAVIPLTASQRVLWLFDRVASGTAAYNMPEVFRVSGVLDAAALSRALDALVARHETLRTVIGGTESEPIQVVRAAVPIFVERHDLRIGSAAEREAQSTTIVREIAHRPFDLTADVLLRAALIQLDDAEHLVVLVTHHIASDGWSRGVMLREVSALYAAFRRGDAPALPELPLQFGDYAIWLERELAADSLQNGLAFWRAQLAGDLPMLELPTDRPRPSTLGQSGARIKHTFPADIVEKANALARAHRTSLFAVLMAAWQLLLARHAGQDEIILGTPIADRGRPELDGCIGYFLKPLPIRTSLRGNPSFGALLDQVRETVLAAFEHRDTPLEMIPGAHGFRALFALQNHQAAPFALDGLETRLERQNVVPARVDLTLTAREWPDRIDSILEYSTELFDEATVVTLLDRFEVLLGAAVEAPHTAVTALPMMTAADRASLTVWNATRVDYPELASGATLASLLAAQAARSPDAIAVRLDTEGGESTLTYAELQRRADTLAQRLAGLGACPGRLVAVSIERSMELVVALVAVLKTGAAYVPLDPEYPAERLRFMLVDAAAEVLLTHAATHSAVAPLVAGTATRVVSVDDGASAVAGLLPAGPSANDVAYMIYTSGSTGQPKGALTTHRGIVNRLIWMQSRYQLIPGDVVLQKTPASFDVSVWEFFWPLISGATLAIARPGGHRDPVYLADAMTRLGVTVVHFVPSMLRAFVDNVPAPKLKSLRSLRHLVCSGEALPADVVRRAFARLPVSVDVHNLYGPTECAVDVTHWTCLRDDQRPLVPIGRPIANTQTHVLDATLEQQPAGVTGELFLGGVQVGPGYHNRPELTARHFIAHPHLGRLYRTGDRARWLRDGSLEFLGRNDAQIKLRGFRIELGEIERALAACEGVGAAAVVVRTDAPGGGGEPALVAYLVATPGAAQPDINVVRARLRSVLAEPMIPSAIVVLDALPLTPSGKLDRLALPAPAEAGASTPTGRGLGPRSDVERVLCGIWSEVLGRDIHDVDASFFDVGGHSLLAIRVVAQLTRIFRSQVSLRQFFDHPTISGIAQALIGDEKKPGQSEQIAALLLKLQSMSPAERDALRSGRPNADAAVELR